MKVSIKISLVLFCTIFLARFASAQNKNIILVITDDLNDAVEGFGGHPQAITPHLDALAQKGVRFTAANCSAPICGPSRASLITGQYPHTNGITGYEQNKNKPQSMPTTQNLDWLFEHFMNNGYNTYGTGKIFHGGQPEPGQFIDWGVDGDQGPWGWDGLTLNGATVPRDFGHSYRPANLKVDYARLSEVPTTDGNFGWFNAKASTFNYVDENNRDLMNDEVSVEYVDSLLQLNHTNPFFITVGIVRPHAPYIAPDTFFQMYDTMSMVMPPLPPFDDMDDIATGLVNNSPGYGVASSTFENFYEVDSTGFYHEEWIKAYLACVTYADHSLGQIMQSLEQSAYDTNTIVIFTSDHGYHFNEKQGAAFKNTGWGEVTRIPFLMYGKGVTANQECTQPITNVDIYKTLVDYAGIPDPGHLDGHSLLGLAADPINGSWTGPEIAVTSVQPQEKNYPLYTPANKDYSHYSARSEQFRYILTSNDEEELYDEFNDPYEWTNLANDPAYESIKLDLRAKLIALTGRRPFNENKTNFVYNGSFEDHLAGYTPQLSGGASGYFKIDSTEFVDGNYSFEFQADVLDNPWNTQLFTDNMTFENGQEYNVSFWAKADNADSRIKFQVRENAAKINFVSSEDTLTTDWKKYSYNFTSTLTSLHDARIQIQFLDVDRYNIDDIRYEKVLPQLVFDCNGDFEDDYNHWSQTANNTAVVNFSIDTIDVYEGNKAACVDVQTLGANPWHQQLVINPDDASCIDTIISGQTYEIGFYGKYPAGSGDLRLAFSTGPTTITKVQTNMSLDTNWVPYSDTWVADTSVSPSGMRIKIQFQDTGKYLIDSVYIKNIIDCHGDTNGSAYIDNCGICVAGNTGKQACIQDCEGNWGGTAYLDSCSNCIGFGDQPCVQDCNGEWGGSSFTDSCGTCVNPNLGEMACSQDCEGIWGGSAYLDSCGTCISINNGNVPCIADCDGVFGGSAYLDSCGVCISIANGNQPCIQDCDSAWGGSAFVDSCGNCAGGNTGVNPITDADSCNLGILNTQSQLVEIFPNPSSGEFNVHLMVNEPVVLRVFSSTGQEVLSREEVGDFKLRSEELPSGLYMVIVEAGNRNYRTKIIKE